MYIDLSKKKRYIHTHTHIDETDNFIVIQE